jgi:hypothetical protein
MCAGSVCCNYVVFTREKNGKLGPMRRVFFLGAIRTEKSFKQPSKEGAISYGFGVCTHYTNMMSFVHDCGGLALGDGLIMGDGSIVRALVVSHGLIMCRTGDHVVVL